MNRFMFFAFLTLSCVHGAPQVAGYPLSSSASGRLPPSQVAELVTSMPGGASVGGGSSAFIKGVDGKDVSGLDTEFELMPGCHTVQTASQLLVANEVMTWSGNIGPRTFVFQMKPGHTYIVKVELKEGLGSTAAVLVYGIEQDQAGRDVQTIEAAKSEQDVRSCSTPAGS